jgi:hypothetical protein
MAGPCSYRLESSVISSLAIVGVLTSQFYLLAPLGESPARLPAHPLLLHQTARRGRRVDQVATPSVIEPR